MILVTGGILATARMRDEILIGSIIAGFCAVFALTVSTKSQPEKV
jgi:hypothetical protein